MKDQVKRKSCGKSVYDDGGGSRDAAVVVGSCCCCCGRLVAAASLSRPLRRKGHGLRGHRGRLPGRGPGHASDVTADAVVLAGRAAGLVHHGRLGGHDAPAPDAAAAPAVRVVVVVVVVVLAVLWRLVMVLMVGVLVVHHLVVVMVLAPLDVVPDLERVGQRVDHGHHQELAHQDRLDGHEDHLDLLLEQVDAEQHLQHELLDLLLDLLLLVMASACKTKNVPFVIITRCDIETESAGARVSTR